MPPKVETALLAVALVGAWIVMENSHRIDLTRPDDEIGRWMTFASCQPVGSRYSAGGALAADGVTIMASPSAGSDAVDVCGPGATDYSAISRDATALP